MDLLLDYLPMTSTLAVCRGRGEAVVEVFLELGRRLQASPRWEFPHLRAWQAAASRSAALAWLLPLCEEATRYVVLPCGHDWVVVIGNGGCGLAVEDAGYVARLAKTESFTLQISPVGRTAAQKRVAFVKGRFDGLSFSMTRWSESEQHDMPVRNVALISDPRPELILYGPPLPGEIADYEKRRGRARVTIQDLARLCELLGVEVLDPKWREVDMTGSVHFVDYGPSERQRMALLLPDEDQPDPFSG